MYLLVLKSGCPMGNCQFDDFGTICRYLAMVRGWFSGDWI